MKSLNTQRFKLTTSHEKITIDIDSGGPNPVDPKQNVRPGLYIKIEGLKK